MSLRFSSNANVDTSALPENPEEMFPQYYIHSNSFDIFKYISVLTSVKGLIKLIIIKYNPILNSKKY